MRLLENMKIDHIDYDGVLKIVVIREADLAPLQKEFGVAVLGVGPSRFHGQLVVALIAIDESRDGYMLSYEGGADY